jgi:hypothetical protein
MNMLAADLDTVVAFPVGWGSLVALVIPLFTALVTKFREGNSKVHAAVALLLAGLVAVLQMLTDDIPNDTWQSVFATFLAVLVPAVVAYLAVWQPVADINKRIAPNKGV